mmetsp:Transcript_94881/g.267891  ORF Transcript_94881/g.267891 Transcript_94881/m.267891 type:complete len:358 (-) Transcript_94881:124-1197(-)
MVLTIAYIAASSGLIAFNKYLMHKDRFPFAIVLVLLHMAFCSVLTGALFLAKPSIFTSFTDPEKKISLDRRLLVSGAVPIAGFFSCTLFLSNVAYLHSSVAFLQMLKESNVVLVYIFSLAFATEHFSLNHAQVLFAIMLATYLTIQGEINFSLLGFLIQGSSQLFESLKIVLQAKLLTNAGQKLDVLSYVLLVTPICLVFLFGVIGVSAFIFPSHLVSLPMWSDIKAWWPYLLVNASVAFLLNVLVAIFMQRSSAMAFILAGIVKDAAIVFAGVFVLGEAISPMQTLGFSLQLTAILLWMVMKTHPEEFKAGLLRGVLLVVKGKDCFGGELLAAHGSGVEEKRPQDRDYGAVEAQKQ